MANGKKSNNSAEAARREATQASGHIRPSVNIDTSVRGGKTASVRLPRDVVGQSRKGCGIPNH